MLIYHNRAAMAEVKSLDIEPTIKRLLVDRIESLPEELIDWTEIVVLQAGDTEADLIRYIGLSPLQEPIDGARWGEPGFWPHWDILEAHEGFWVFTFTFGSTFAYVLIVTDDDGVPLELRQLCRAFEKDSGRKR